MTYDQLVSQIEAWLIGHDLNSVIPTLIALAEDRHYNDIRVRAMTTRSRSIGNDTRFLALPDGYVDMRRLWYLTQKPYQLIQVSPEGLEWGGQSGTRNSTARPTRYAVHEELEFNADVSSDAEVEMVYWKRFDRIDSQTSNWLLENAYGCYLYGALAEAAPYIADDERVGTWEMRYQTHKDAVLAADQRSRTGGAPRVSVEGMNP